MKYIARLIDGRISEKLKYSGYILIDGVKACGKTESAKRFARSSVNFEIDQNAKAQVELSPNAILQGETPRLFDEWQKAPQIWNLVRNEVDNRQKDGQFILTGSAFPNKEKQVSLHSGAGRLGKIKMRPLSWLELGFSSGAVSLGSLINGAVKKLNIVETKYPDTDDLITRVMVGGWPKNVTRTTKNSIAANVDYVDATINSDLSRLTDGKYDKVKVTRLVRSLARNISTIVDLSTIIDDVIGTEGSSTFDKNTASRYLSALERIMIVENVPAWSTHIRSTATLRKSPKRNFVDPSIAVASLRLSKDKLINDLRYFGFLFESLVIMNLRIYSEMNDAEVFYYKDDSNTASEVDAIVERSDGKWVAIEIKTGTDEIDSAAKNLLDFREKINVDKQSLPSALVVITGTGFTHTRPDGVHVVSIGSLGV